MATITQLAVGSNATLSTTSSTGSVTLTGAPVVFTITVANSAPGFGVTGVVWNGASESLTQMDLVSSASQVGQLVYYIDAPTPGTSNFTVTHSNLSSRRNLAVYEVTGHDTSTSSAWRDAPVNDNNTTTDAETNVSSATGDTPVLFIGVRVTSSAPTLTFNGSSTSLTNFIGGTTLRSYACYGTGAATVTLGGTLSGAGNNAAVGFNINSSSGTSPIAAISAGYHNQGLR